MTKNIEAQQLGLKRRLRDQRDTTKRIRLDTGMIRDNQASLAQSMSSQLTEVRDLLNSQARDQERAFASQESIVAQTGIELQNMKALIETMVASQSSVVTCVHSRSPRDMSDILGRGSTPFQEHLLQDMIQYQQQLLAKLQDIHDVNRLGREIPAQVLFSKPVTLLDACGRVRPFFLETVGSADVRDPFHLPEPNTRCDFDCHIGLCRLLEVSL